MVFDKRPDELLSSVVQQGLVNFKTAISGVLDIVRSGDETIREMDDALTGGRARPGETPQETFSNILELLEAAVAEARDKGSAGAPSVAQRAREILTRINQVEPAWRSAPTTITRPSDIFRSALRDLRASGSLIKLAQGAGTLEDLEGISKWADDLNNRIEMIKAPRPVPRAPAAEEGAPQKTAPKRQKKDTTPKQKPADADVVFALAVAEEYNDPKVKQWAQEFASGRISEAQWQSRLTNHAAAERDNLDDVFERALARIAREKDGK
jgi:hypothetical protein